MSASASALPAVGKGRARLGRRRRRPRPPQCCDWSAPEGGGTSQQSLAPPPPTLTPPSYSSSTDRQGVGETENRRNVDHQRNREAVDGV